MFYFNSTSLTPRGDQHANSNNQQICNANIQMIYIEMFYGEMRELLITSERLQSFYHTEIFRKFYLKPFFSYAWRHEKTLFRKNFVIWRLPLSDMSFELAGSPCRELPCRNYSSDSGIFSCLRRLSFETYGFEKGGKYLLNWFQCDLYFPFTASNNRLMNTSPARTPFMDYETRKKIRGRKYVFQNQTKKNFTSNENPRSMQKTKLLSSFAWLQ